MELKLDNKIGISLVAFKNVESIREFFEKHCLKTDDSPFFELSYIWNQKQTEKMSFLKGRVLSGHAPCPGGNFLPNLGSDNPEVIDRSIESLIESAKTTASFGGSILVLHAGYTMDALVYRQYEQRKAVLDKLTEQHNYLWIKEGAVCRPEYTKADFYLKYLQRTIKNIRKAMRICREEGVKLAVENLNPRLTYLFQTSDDLKILLNEIPDASICIDIGHLWISSLIHNFNFLEQLADILETGRVVSSHIHDNESRLIPDVYIGDDHGTIGTGNIPMKQAIELIESKSDANLIIEVKNNPLENYIHLMNSLYKKT